MEKDREGEKNGGKRWVEKGKGVMKDGEEGTDGGEEWRRWMKERKLMEERNGV